VNFFNIIMRFLYDVHKMSAFKAGRFCSYVWILQGELKVCLENLRACSGNQNNRKSFYEHGVENASLPRYYIWMENAFLLQSLYYDASN
jgi:hypothetical protein